MHCDGCASRIKALAENLPAVQARILFDPQSVGGERVATLVHDAGFRVVDRDSRRIVISAIEQVGDRAH